MSYQWDNKKPTAQMLGRWQPFHDGHYALFEEIVLPEDIQKISATNIRKKMREEGELE